MPSWEIPGDVDKLFRTLEIREENGIEFPRDLSHLRITIHKSALFHRLLQGKEPLPIPPPRSHSYPWYELIENGVGYPFEVWKPKSWDASFTPYPSIVIDQSPWKMLEELGEQEWLVTYPYGKHDDKGMPSFAEGKWHVQTIGCRLPRKVWEKSSSSILWEIRKIE